MVVAVVVSIRRDEGSLSGFGTKLLCVLNRSGWAADVNAGFGGPGRSVGYGVLGVGRKWEERKTRI